MEEMKSAFERAMERVEKLEDASAEEKAKWKYIPEGEKLAVRYLANECNLENELAKYDPLASRYVISALAEILIRNVDLPRSDVLKANTRKAMEGIKVLNPGNAAVDKVFEQIRYVLEHFENDGARQKKQAYEALKSDFQVRIEQAMQGQAGVAGKVDMDVERQPQFQKEWRATLAQLDSQYYKVLNEHKDELRTLLCG